MDNRAVADALERIATLLDLKDENAFKIRAYRNAARIVEGLTTDVNALVVQGKLEEIKGIGKGLAEKITELVTTGRCAQLEELQAEFPAGLFDVLSVPGLGAKKVATLWRELGVHSLSTLEKACRSGKVAELEGFGEKTQAKILEGIEFKARAAGRYLLARAREAAAPLLELLRAMPQVVRCEVAGSVRRWRETVKDVDLVASVRCPEDAAAVMEAFRSAPGVKSVVAHGESKSAVRLENNLPAELRVVTDGEFPCALHHLTGSQSHNVALRSMAQKAGLKISEHGLYRGGEPIPCKTEADLYAALGLQEIPPEMREGAGEIELAEARKIPRLIERGDVRGLLHMHTTWSDGMVELEDYCRRGIERGFEWLGIADHSKQAAYAGGLTEKELAEQGREIDALNKKYAGKITLLKGVEADILPDGRPDYDAKTLESLDFVVASVHMSTAMPEAQMTERVRRALSDPNVDVLAHPTGRLLLSREPYAIDLEQVLQAAKAHAKAVECNCHPQRLDLDAPWLRRAKALGVTVSLGPDAHVIDGLDDVAYGIGMARRGWLAAGEVLSTWPLKKLLAWLR